MKSTNQLYRNIFSISGRRRNYLSALATGLLFLLGFSQPSHAAGNVDKYIIQVPIDNAIAGSGSDKVTLQIVGPGGVLVLGQDISFSVAGLSTPAQTDGAGTYFFTPSSGEAKSYVVTVLLDKVKVIGTVTINFIVGPPATNPPAGSPNPSYFIVTHNDAVADGSDKDFVQIHLSSPFGVDEPAGTLVTLTVTSSNQASTDALLNGTTTTTITVPLGAGGLVDIPITDISVGSVTLQATYPGDPVPIGGPGYTKTVNFVAGPPDPAKSYIKVTQDNGAANSSDQDVVTAYLFDAQGRPTSGTVNFTIQTGTAAFAGTVTGTGTVSTSYTSGIVGAVQVQAALADGTFLNDQLIPANNYATIHFTNGPPDPAKSYIVVTQDFSPANGLTKDVVTAYLFDAQGRPTNGTINFSINPSGIATLVNTVIGTGTVSAEYVSGTVGVFRVQASYNGVFLNDQLAPGINFVRIHFVIGPPDPSKSYIVVSQDGALADGLAQNTVKAYLFDAQGRAIIDGTTVTFSIGGTATIVNPADATQPVTAGSVAAQYVSNAVGAVKVQASYVLNGVTYYLNDQTIPANNFATMHFVAGSPVPGDPGGGGTGGNPPGGGGNPPAGGGGPGGGPGGSNLKFTVLFVRQQYDFRFADGQQQDSVYAYVTDGYQHPLKNVSIQFFIQNAPTSGTATANAQFVGSPANVLTDDSGMARIAITSTKPGTVFVNAVLIVDGVLIDGSYQIVTFLNKPDVNNPLTNLSVVIYTALADGTQVTQVKAHIVDLDGNVMPGQDVTFSLDSGKATIVTPQPATTDANGDAYITLTSTTPGYALVTAVVNGESIKFGSPARVRFAAINIYVPRVFTPNGDGSNDQLKPILVGIAEFHYFSVYNRWGNLIFTTQDANRGWDGTFKGVPQPVETYLWIGEGIDITGKKIVQKGMVSLVR